jgi:creatinine amidohydrolase
MLVLEELTSWELEQLVRRGCTTVVIPFGSIEYQGGHLPLGADALLAETVGGAVAERLDAVVAPTVRVGCAQEHVEGAGTLAVPFKTLHEVALHIGRSLAGHGFRLLALLSTHGGNRAAIDRATQRLSEEYPDLAVCAPRGDLGPEPGRHSGRWLTSVMLSLRPDLVDLTTVQDDLKDEIAAAHANLGNEYLERYIASIIRAVRDVQGPAATTA